MESAKLLKLICNKISNKEGKSSEVDSQVLCPMSEMSLHVPSNDSLKQPQLELKSRCIFRGSILNKIPS
jgi:hypothetical protein